MSQELLVVTERVHYKRKISRSSHNINYLEVPSNGYMPLCNNGGSGYGNSGRQRSSSVTSSPTKATSPHKHRRRRSLSPRLTGKSGPVPVVAVQRRSSFNSICTRTSNRQLQEKPVTLKRISVLILGGENAGKTCLEEYLNGSTISSSNSSDDWEGSVASSTTTLPDVNFRAYNDPNGLSHVYKYDLVLLIYSVTDVSTFKYINSVINVATNLHEIPVILIGNKIDLVRARVVPTNDGHRLASENNLKFIETSVLLNLNMNNLLNGIKAQVGLKSSKKKVKLFEKIAGFLTYGRLSRSCLDLHTL